MEAVNVLPENINQLVSFTMADEEFSFPINVVQEIVRLPKVTPVPGAPDSVKGIMNLRGSILPLIDLRKRLKLDDVQYNDNSRVVVIRHQERNTGMIVDRVNEVLQVEKDQIEPPPADLESSRTSVLRCIARIDNGRRVVMILSEDKLLPSVDARSQDIAGYTVSDVNQEKELKVEDEKLLVIFRLVNEEFAVNIMEVREIVRVGDIVRVPQVPDFVLGVMPLRDALLPVIDLRLRLGMVLDADKATTAGEAEIEVQDNETDARRIIVADIGGVTTGLMVDAVSDVLRLQERDVEPTPDAIDPDNAKYIQGVGKLDNGSRLLLLLDLARLLSREEKETITAVAEKQQGKGGNSMVQKENLVGERQLVCFRIADEEYGIDIMQVREIIRLDVITEVPGAPSYVSGIVNLRGNILPVIDLRQRFGRKTDQHSEQNRILVVDIGDKKTGIIVDAVSEVIRIPESNIEPAPQILSDNVSSRYVDGIGKMDGGKRTIILVNTDTLLEQEEIEALPGKDDSLNLQVDVKAEKTVESAARTEEKNLKAEKPAERQFERDKKVKELMSLKKDELLTRAREININVNAKMTKKQIAEQLVEQESIG
ncbi:MAG: hypothetical protein DRH50_14490 [Deltaproteobacteria bacterium]|nr:MAG: hypothetical protein DRH50_14490 [Deltaproteobacteria bacterium]